MWNYLFYTRFLKVKSFTGVVLYLVMQLINLFYSNISFFTTTLAKHIPNFIHHNICEENKRMLNISINPLRSI